MLDSFPVAVVAGILFGFLAGLGVGGGSLLMLWLTMVLQIEYTTARTVNLLFFLPTALIGCWIRQRQGALDLKKILPAVIFGTLSAALCTIGAQSFDINILKKLFGILLLFTGMRELFYRPRKAR